MSESQSTLTAQSAPRNLEALLKESSFKLRLLAQSLKGLDTEEQKFAWHNGTSQMRAETVLGLLKEWDAKNANGVAPATNGAAPQVSTVTPAAAEAAAAAAATERPKRQPRTGGSAQNAAADNLPTTAALGADVLKLITGTSEAISVLAGQLGNIEKAMDDRGRLEGKVDELLDELRDIKRTQRWTLMAFLTFMQENMGAGTTDLLAAAIGDSGSLDALSKQAAELAGVDLGKA